MKELLYGREGLLLFLLLLLYAYSGFAQDRTLEFKIQILEKDSTTASNKWGVYVRPSAGFETGNNGTVTASGQVTIKMLASASDSILNIESVNGYWATTADAEYVVVRNPEVGGAFDDAGTYVGGSAAGFDYFSIGLIDEGAGIPLLSRSATGELGDETLLFTFNTNIECPDTLLLFKNRLSSGSGEDPFEQPNSLGTNPGMDLAVFNTNTNEVFNWQSNYDPEAAECDDSCDMDGVPDGLEFLNGTDPCDVCDPLGVANFAAKINGGDTLRMCQAQDSAQLVITTTGGPGPYTYYLHGRPTDNTTPEFKDTISNVYSGDTFYVKPAVTSFYRLDSIVDSLTCSLDLVGISDSVLVSVEGPLSWNTGGRMLPDTEIRCTLDTIKFGVDASNGGIGELSYQWMVSENGGPFEEVINGTPYSKADTDTLVIGNPDGLNNNRYFVKVFTDNCDTIVSDTTTLLVEGPFIVNSSPVDQIACGLDTVSFIAATENAGTGITEKQWQSNDGSGWQLINNGTDNGITYEGALKDTLVIRGETASDDISALNEHWYRLFIKGTGNVCDTIFTDSAFLQVDGPLVIQAENLPKDTSSCIGEVACFGVKVDEVGGPLEYQWYMSNDGTDWTALSNDGNFSGVRADSMCILNVDTLDGKLFKVDIQTAFCSSISTYNPSDLSSAASLSVKSSIDFTSDPRSEAICGGDTTLFIVKINSDDTNLMKQWQMSADTGKTWTDVLSTGGLYSGMATDTLKIDTRTTSTTEPDTLNGYLFRMSVSGDLCSEVLSREAALAVHYLEDDMIVMGPLSDTICSGNPAFFEVEMDGTYTGDSTVLKYQWQILNPVSMAFVDLRNNQFYNGVTSERLSLSDVNGFNGMKFRAKVYTSECDSIVHPSDTIKLTVDGPYVFGADNDAHPQDTTVCAGATAMFTSEPVLDLNTEDFFGNPNRGDSLGLTYQWVYNKLGDYDNPDTVATADWYTMSPTPGTGADGTTLTIYDVPDTLNGYAFWLRMKAKECDAGLPLKSLPAILTVDSPLKLTTAFPSDTISNCSDQGVRLGVMDSIPDRISTIQYQWREYNNDTWRNLPNDSIYNGARSDTLSISSLYGLNGNEYTLIAFLEACSTDTVKTDTVYLREEGPISITRNPDDILACATEEGYFVATAIDSTTLDDSNLQYIWQVREDSRGDWSNLSNGSNGKGGEYSGVTTDSMTIDSLEGLNGFRYRLAVTNESGTCDTVFSLPARVRAEGPVTFNAMDETVEPCQNDGVNIKATLDFESIGGGIPRFHWQVMHKDSTNFDSLINDNIYDATASNHLFITKVFEDKIDTVINEQVIRDTLLNLTGYSYRLAATTEQCLEVGDYFYSDTVLIQPVSDTITTCDFDQDGLLNMDDDDDDNDGLMDSVEIRIDTSLNSFADSVSQFSIDADGDGIIDSEEDADGDDINNGEETDDDNADGSSDEYDVFTGDPLDPCSPILSPACVGVVLDVRVKLQGAMLGVRDENGDIDKKGHMRDDLRQKGLIPMEEPYSDLKVKHLGVNQRSAFIHVPDHSTGAFAGGNEEIDPLEAATILDDLDSNSVVDWVFVELRSGLQLDSVIATRSALLQRDGDIRDVIAPLEDDPLTPEDEFANRDTSRYDKEGFAYLRFDSTLAGEYYVSVRHRNHLGVMTNEAGVLSPKLAVIDFIDPKMNALGTHPQKLAAEQERRSQEIEDKGTMIYTDSLAQWMWAGDLNSDGKIIYQGGQNDIKELLLDVTRAQNDQNNSDQNDPPKPILTNFILTEYQTTDYNLDGNVIYQGPNNDRQMLIFNSILAFPDNQKLLANYVILEQLP